MVTRCILLLILFVVIFFHKQIFFNEVFYCCDNVAINIPSKVYLVEELKHGRFPILNPYILSGSAFLADINLGIFYPLNALYFFFSAFDALTVGVIISFIIAAIGMYILVKSLQVSHFGSVVSAVIFTFSGAMITYINNVPMLQVASLLPWVMWAWVQFFSHFTKQYYIVLISFLVLQIFAGHPQFTYYTWILGVGYVLFFLRISWMEKIKYLFFVGIGAFVLSAVQTIPFVELVARSTRIGRDFSYASFDSLHPFNLFRFVIPNIVGNISRGTDWIQGGSIYGYIGALPLLLVFFISYKNRLKKFFIIVAAVSLILALGKYTPIFFVFYTLIPGIGYFRSPQHFLFLYTFAVSILVGFSVDGIFYRKSFLRVLLYCGICFLTVGVVMFLCMDYISLPIAKFQTFSPLVQKSIVEAIVYNIMYIGSTFLGLSIVCLFFRKNISVQKTLLLFAIFIELFIFSSHGMISIDKNQVKLWLATGQEMAKRMTDEDLRKYRVFISPALYRNPVGKQFGVPYIQKETAWQISILRTNISMLYGLSTIDGYASLIDRSYKELFQKGEGDPTGIDFGDMSAVPWDDLGVRYILATTSEEIFKKDLQFIPIWSDGYKILYKNVAPDASIHVKGKKE